MDFLNLNFLKKSFKSHIFIENFQWLMLYNNYFFTVFLRIKKSHFTILYEF